MRTDVRRSENRWKGCKAEGAERLSKVYRLNWLDRRKTIYIVKHGRILHIKQNLVEQFCTERAIPDYTSN